VHEWGHAVYAGRLTAAQRSHLVDEYLAHLLASRAPHDIQPTEQDAEHYFVRLLMAAVLGAGTDPLPSGQARQVLRRLGLDLA
jgi:hypothetical protein